MITMTIAHVIILTPPIWFTISYALTGKKFTIKQAPVKTDSKVCPACGKLPEVVPDSGCNMIILLPVSSNYAASIIGYGSQNKLTPKEES
ncbi:hypothetical protein SAMN04488502_11356 [Dendrosporobacter quercicolus]|uniref:Uncharacterized protein n=1 Tax=Dendrosporobacter quercicolus TaxID=146817 RepID=A0A1G9Z896_9FIRM|nr:hypothetical protein SAMN04488502_11356 [Dendrosporobacter quercicolus]